jgi:hypothetical protein
MKRENIDGYPHDTGSGNLHTLRAGLQFPCRFDMILITVRGNPWAVNSTTVSGPDSRAGKGRATETALSAGRRQAPATSGLAEAVGDEG